ncbi:uncharacterized protein LOC127869655 isoform X2 [Dreissena polymorpha]|uniref:uncharacterized protein LOC127869655 isoform X2 n=1 Tax=Dreissena polymorpha TaxID=45954 RepID=UPI0022650FD5|nr:uncharacterized protein LOC127869655 isoform X2 [Dreissena polymorpha]
MESLYSDWKYLYSKFIWQRKGTMNYTECARELKASIRAGRVSELRGLLEPYRSSKEVKEIDEKFMRMSDPPIDPINFAIECGKEKAAIYLVEKAFPLNHVFWEERGLCDEWSSKEHGPDKCPRQYDCGKNAERHGMELLKLKIDAIRQGKARPGEGISEPLIEKFLPHTPPPKQNKPPYETDDHSRFVPEKKEPTLAMEASELVQKFGIKYSTKSGGTLLHQTVDKPRVFTYILANNGVPINVQDKNGDTALHLAVREGKMEIVEALVQCSADLTLRNKLGQTPVDEAEGPIKTFLRTFEPSVIVAVRDNHFNMLYRLYKRSWCNVHTRVKEGKSLLEWTRDKAESLPLTDVKPSLKNEYKKEKDTAKKAFQLLSDYRPTSELIHAVLCEDAELARTVLWENPGLCVNNRYRDRIGKTILSHAVEVNNYELVKLLVDNGANVAQMRVRENEKTNVTIPLYQKALRRDLDVNIVKLLQTVLHDDREHSEKDQNGNTPLLRAIEEGVDTQTIHWLIKVRGGYSLMDRNKDGFTARELAQKRGRDSTVKMIDRYIAKELPAIVLRLFPVAFYPQELLNIVDEAGESLDQKLVKIAEKHNVKTWIDCNQTQNHAISLFEASARGDVEKVNKLNDASYQDKNGYTALIRAIAFNQYEVANQLCILRPPLKKIADNCNRYPLHYAYALPEAQGRQFIRLILDSDANEIENRVDKDGRVAAMYKDLRGNVETLQMLYDARTLDAFGKRGAPLGPWPKDAHTLPPTMTEEEADRLA